MVYIKTSGLIDKHADTPVSLKCLDPRRSLEIALDGMGLKAPASTIVYAKEFHVGTVIPTITMKAGSGSGSWHLILGQLVSGLGMATEEQQQE